MQPVEKESSTTIIKNEDGYVAVFSIEAIEEYVGWRAMTTLREYGSKKNINSHSHIDQDGENGNGNGKEVDEIIKNEIRNIEIASMIVVSELGSKNKE